MIKRVKRGIYSDQIIQIQRQLILLLVAAANVVKQGLVPEQANGKLGAPRLPSLGLIISGAYLLGRG